MTNAQDTPNLHRPLELAVAIPALVGAGLVLMQAVLVFGSANSPHSPYSGEPMPIMQAFSFVLATGAVLTGFSALMVVLGRRWGLLALGVCLILWTLFCIPAHRFGYGLLTGLGAVYLISRYSTR